MDGLFTIRTGAGVPFTVNSAYAPRFKGLLDGLESAGYPINPNQSGGYNKRNIAGTNTPSNHAFGRAVDVNWTDNPRGSQGAIPADLARRLAKENGMVWGGDWRNPDPMHFEVANAAPTPMSGRGLTSFAGLSKPTGEAEPMAGLFNLGAGMAKNLPRRDMGPGMETGSVGLMDAPQQGGSWLDALNGRLSASAQTPLFQFGAGMAGAGSNGQGLGGGVAAGAGAVQKGQDAALERQVTERKLAELKQRDEFMTALNDPNNPLSKNLSPEVAMALKGLPPEQAAQVLARSLGGGVDTPSSVREYQFFNKLPANEQERYLTMKRQNSNAVVGDEIINKRTGETVRNIGDNLQNAERVKEVGTMQGKQEGSAPSDIAAADVALSILKDIENDTNMEVGTGFSSYGNVIRGTAGYDFQNKVNQATAGAFLVAIQQMRGLGALSNSEGQTAKDAVTAMNTSTSEEAFKKALGNYRKLVETGRTRALARLNGGQAARPDFKSKYGLE